MWQNTVPTHQAGAASRGNSNNHVDIIHKCNFQVCKSAMECTTVKSNTELNCAMRKILSFKPVESNGKWHCLMLTIRITISSNVFIRYLQSISLQGELTGVWTIWWHSRYTSKARHADHYATGTLLIYKNSQLTPCLMLPSSTIKASFETKF